MSDYKKRHSSKLSAPSSLRQSESRGAPRGAENERVAAQPGLRNSPSDRKLTRASSDYVSADVRGDFRANINRSKSNQAMMLNANKTNNERRYAKPMEESLASYRGTANNNFDIPLKLAPRQKNAASSSREGYSIHRAEGMFDLSSIHKVPDYGSVYNLLEEFKKQIDVSAISPVSKAEDSATRTSQNVQLTDSQSQGNSLGRRCYDGKDSMLPLNHSDRESLNSVGHQTKREEDGLSNLLRTRDTGRVTTDSEEELLAQILLSMSHSTSSAASHEDESDYANLWDSESRASGPTFQTNEAVMGSLLRKKVDGRLAQDTERRKAWVSTSTYSDSLTSSQSNEIPFNMDKFRSLQEKAENLDLTLTDFFADLKHSSSILELSKMFPSTQMISSIDCKFKCHQHCEDSLSTQCTGPITDKSQRGADSWADHKHLRHDAADDADSGYSGSGGSAGFTLTKEEICSKINAYNENVGRSSGAMTFPSDGSDSFQGCIKVCVCIDRPISMSLSSRPTSIFEALHREEEVSPQTSPKNTVAAEHLPHNAQVSLHTNSLHTASEVVGILLNKFKITDNPKSFALFEQTIQYEKEVKLRKIGDQERPLLNYLRWSTESEDSKRFVLKENDSGDIMYEAFSIPELNNFLRVLEEEEAVKLTDIQNKFQVRRKQLADRLREIDMERSSIKPSSLRTGR